MARSPLLAARRDSSLAGIFRVLGSIAVLALLSACAGQVPVNQAKEAASYQAHAARNYTPPGPPGDPWGPYVNEAAGRFDVPPQWIRQVMRAESGGHLYENGQLITSWVGAMGLMQVMPETYDGLRIRYSLGDDAYDPHNNILAGTAYIREMYDLYGAPAFLAAYNAGPARLDDYLNNVRPLPDETRHYVAKIAPNIQGYFPAQRSPAEDVAMNQIPIDIPTGLRYPKPHLFAAARRNDPHPAHHGDYDRDVAQLPTPPHALPGEPPRVQTAMATSHGGGIHLISPAAADTLPVRRGGPATGKWAVQVGAFGNESQARNAADAARGEAHAEARSEVGTVHQPRGTVYRARLTGLSRDAAIQACERLGRGKGNCIVLSPAAQS